MQSKRERARCMAFLVLKGEVELFGVHEKALKKIDVDLVDWLAMESSVRDMKIDFLQEAKV